MKKKKQDVPRILIDLKRVFNDNITYEEFDTCIKDIQAHTIPQQKYSLYATLPKIIDRIVEYPQKTVKTLKSPINVYVDRLQYILLFYYWSKSKEIFDFDKDFLKELVKTPVEEIPINSLKELPYNTFACTVNDEYIIVHKTYDTSLHPITNKKISCEFIYLYIYDSTIQKMLFFPLPLIDEFKNADRLRDCYNNQKGVDDSIRYINMLMYLISDKGDIKENEKQKNITRRTTTTKNAVREIRKWDVGYRFGNAYRKNNYERPTIKQNKSEIKNSMSKGQGVRKRAHVRRGHWHKFWTGKRGSDEQKQIIRWVSPVAVNFDSDNENKPAVIHKVY